MPLTYRDRGPSGTQQDVMSGDEIIAHLWQAMLPVAAGHVVHWRYTFHSGPTRGNRKHGSAETIERAKAQIEDQWRDWLTTAGLRE